MPWTRAIIIYGQSECHKTAKMAMCVYECVHLFSQVLNIEHFCGETEI